MCKCINESLKKVTAKDLSDPFVGCPQNILAEEVAVMVLPAEDLKERAEAEESSGAKGKDPGTGDGNRNLQGG